jgi:hypothetical protein
MNKSSANSVSSCEYFFTVNPEEPKILTLSLNTRACQRWLKNLIRFQQAGVINYSLSEITETFFSIARAL